jgi:hypothetical protein
LKKEELIRKLNKARVMATGNLAAVQKLAMEKGIPLYEENLPKIRQGWQGKQKGFFKFSGKEVGLMNLTLNNTQWMVERMPSVFFNNN